MSKKAESQNSSSALIKCRVRPNNSYGMIKAGEIVEVSAQELALVPHCLVSLEQELKEEEARKQSFESKAEKTHNEIEHLRSQGRAALEAQIKAAAMREKAKAEAAEKSARAIFQEPT